MENLKPAGQTIKGRHVAVFGIMSDPTLWMIFDEPVGYKSDEQDDTCKTYNYQDKLHAMTSYNKIIKAYKRSKKNHYTHAIKLRGTRNNV